MLAWLAKNFEVTLKFKSENGVQAEAPLAWFVQAFGPNAPASAEELKAKDPDDKLGWHCYIDDWEKQGKFAQPQEPTK